MCNESTVKAAALAGVAVGAFLQCVRQHEVALVKEA
jgi:hypothetical protein